MVTGRNVTGNKGRKGRRSKAMDHLEGQNEQLPSPSPAGNDNGAWDLYFQVVLVWGWQ